MHVALIHDRVGGQAGGGGGVRLMLEIGMELQELGHRVTVVCHDFDPATTLGGAAERLDVVPVQRGPFEPPSTRTELLRRQWIGMRAVSKLVPGDVDVVNAHEWPASRAGRLASRRIGVPFVWTRNDDTVFERGVVPDTTLFERPSPAGRLVRTVAGLPDVLDARAAAAIVVLGTRNKEAVARAYRRDSVIMRCGPADFFFDHPDRGEARARVGVGDETFLAAAIGIMFPHRRFEDLIEAVAGLPADSPLRLLIVGSDHADPGYADGLERLIRSRGVDDRVRLERRAVSEPELRDIYAAADVTVFPNRAQAYGLAPLESLASGTPVLLSTGIGVGEALEGRPGVRRFPPERPDLLAATLTEAMRPGFRDEAAETREWVRSELSNRRYAERMAELFAVVAGSSGVA